MVCIIRSIENTDLEKGLRDICLDEMGEIDENILKNIIEKHKDSYVLYNINMKKIYAVVLSNTISIQNISISCYSIYYKKHKEEYYYKLLNHYVSKNKKNLFFRKVNNIDLSDNNFIDFIGKDNKKKIKKNIKDTFILHTDKITEYVSVRTIIKYNEDTSLIIEDAININKHDSKIMDELIDAIYPIKIRELYKNDSLLGFEKLLMELKPSINKKIIENDEINQKNKCDIFIAKMLEELKNIAKVYVLVSKNQIIGTGTIYYQPKLHRNSDNIEYAAFIEDIVISSSFRKLGLGKFFVNYLINKSQHPDIESLANYKVYKVSLNCDTSLSKFYEKANLQIKGYQMATYV